MKNAIRYMFAALLALLLTPLPASAQPSGPMPKDIGFEQHHGASLPLNLEFRDESGRTVKLADSFREGRPVVLALAYYGCPMLCTMVLNGLITSLKATGLKPGVDFEVVVVSIDAREKPELARAKKDAYMRSYGQPGGEEAFHFLTGDEAAIREVTNVVGFRYAYDPVGDQFAHASGVTVLTPEGRISRYLFGVDYAPKDMRLSLVEAAGGKIGSVTDKFLLLCYKYDPERGRYGALAIGSIRVGGVLTLLVLGTSIFMMRRRERKQSQSTPGGKA